MSPDSLEALACELLSESKKDSFLYVRRPASCRMHSRVRKVNMERINLAEKFALFEEHWTPKILAEANGNWSRLQKGRARLSGTLMRMKTSCSLCSRAC